MTLKKIVLHSFFYVCAKFHGKILLNVILLNSFVGIVEMWQGFAYQNILCWTIISFIYALISQHNVRLEHKSSSITKKL
jgi:hypothetical protein